MEISGWDAAALCAKALTYAATLCAAGAVFFLAYCNTLLTAAQRGRVRRLVGFSVVAAAVASAARILLLAGSMSGDFAGMFDMAFARMILNAGEWRATGMRILGLALTALAISANSRLQTRALLGAIIASTSFAWVGHVHALPGLLPALILGLHLLCAAFWLGALLPLLIVAQDGAHSQVAAAAARFGTLALAVVGLLLAAGAGLLWMLIRNASEFWGSAYGWMMACKLIGVALLLSLAALNKLYLTPRLAGGNALSLLRRSIQTEIAVGVLILSITAAFTTLTGPPH